MDWSSWTWSLIEADFTRTCTVKRLITEEKLFCWKLADFIVTVKIVSRKDVPRFWCNIFLTFDKFFNFIFQVLESSPKIRKSVPHLEISRSYSQNRLLDSSRLDSFLSENGPRKFRDQWVSYWLLDSFCSKSGL